MEITASAFNMASIKQSIKNFIDDEEGATAIEYGLIAGLISVALVASLTLVGDRLEGVFERIANALTGTSTTTP